MQPLTPQIPSQEQTYLIDINPTRTSITLYAPRPPTDLFYLTYTAREMLKQIPAFIPTSTSDWTELQALPAGRRIFIHLRYLQSVKPSRIPIEGEVLTLNFPNLSLNLYPDHLSLQKTYETLKLALNLFQKANPSPTLNQE